MRILPVLLLFLAGFSAPANAQQTTLFMPRNIQRAYDAGARAANGKPGPKYWQNRSRYDIDVSVDLKKRLVKGRETIRYENNSPDTLKSLRLKLAHDLWRKNGQRNYDLDEKDITDGVLIGAVEVRGATLPKDKINQANTFLTLSIGERPLPPGQAVELSVEWQYTAPQAKGAPRECVCDPTSWFAAYWYPQMAVYDDLHGWADAPYNGLQEMYNDFSDYTVNITVPGNVMVWATGVWSNAESLLQQEFFQRYQKSLSASEVVKVFSPDDYKAKTAFFKKAKTHTFTYKAENVPDFAFALSDHYLWDASSTLVDPATGRRAGVSAAYNPASQDYYSVCEVASKALYTMSTYLPGYPYPYPRMTVFNGDDGMEFPMMCNDASTHPNSPVGLTVHESSHTYFPFMMGINEQYYAWMDEGWAAFFDVMVTDTIVGKPTGRLRNYPDFAGTDADMPPMTPSRHLNSPAYRVASYNRPQAAYMALYQMLGHQRFRQCMNEYMNRWKGKHPQPFDFFNTWNDVAAENLNWFWKPWFFDWGYPDLAVTGVEENGSNPKIIVENTGTMPMSAMGEVEYSDGTKEYFMRSAAFWKDGAKRISIPVAVGKTVKKVTLGNRLVSDTRADNNVWK